MIKKLLILYGVIIFIPCTAAHAELFRMPVYNPDGQYVNHGWILGVDHDPIDYGGLGTQCINYAGNENFPYCYDQHDGTDFLLEGGFDTMDEGVAWIFAAADGVVVATEDGHYDRCHADIITMDVSCDGHEMEANYVIVEHPSGMRTKYWHMKEGSVTVLEGDIVHCGDVLGLVGSSGYSSTPHLHFQVEDASGAVIDPYAGIMSQPESYWVQQEGWYGLPGAFCIDALETDSDDDGVMDAEDDCPDIPDPDQNDTDGDRMGDVCDPDFHAPTGDESPAPTEEPSLAPNDAPGATDAASRTTPESKGCQLAANAPRGGSTIPAILLLAAIPFICFRRRPFR